jgi:hypothetical protein
MTPVHLKSRGHTSEPRPKLLRASHRRVLQLFRTYGNMTDQEALGVANSEGWHIAPSSLRSRRAEVTPPRGRGIRDTGRKRNHSTVWDIDPSVTEPFAGRA